MTNETWENATDPGVMIDHLSRMPVSMVMPSDLRLAACAVVRSAMTRARKSLMPHYRDNLLDALTVAESTCLPVFHPQPASALPAAQAAVAALGQDEDGDILQHEVEVRLAVATCCSEQQSVMNVGVTPDQGGTAGVRAHRATVSFNYGQLRVAVHNAWHAVFNSGNGQANQTIAHAIADVLAGRLIRPNLSLLVRSWRGGIVPKEAARMVMAGQFADVPILADMAEDAGCTDGRLLDHLRSGRAHYRGCWAVVALGFLEYPS